ncbi:MAG: MarR family winged helix-turn-helix transcriptional regulator [Rhodovarius sp.]|nr:MarR family winged helix-turn-helix transcriptional regulator [Rhodovarius sp.]MCX7932100.1 MarR family winged helix-turn-helix transcriptional regulator [Rhodovarius sp.]MDW8315468.1 MarR family winged helix-turn-helix transcriptional regulator [Rhodovarius sp.]
MSTPFDLAKFLPYRLAVAAQAVSARFARRYSEAFGLTIPEWRVLAVLGGFGTTHAQRLTALTTMDKVKVSRAVAKLAAAGLVQRQPDPEDGRRVLLALTPKGEQLYRDIVPLAQAMQEELLAELPPAGREALDEALRLLSRSPKS